METDSLERIVKATEVRKLLLNMLKKEYDNNTPSVDNVYCKALQVVGRHISAIETARKAYENGKTSSEVVDSFINAYMINTIQAYILTRHVLGKG